MLRKISDLYAKVEKQTTTKRLVLAAAHDEHALGAVYTAVEKGIITAVLAGDKEKIEKIAQENNYDLSKLEIIDEKNKDQAVKICVQLVNQGKADILMKGNVPTATLLRGVLNDEWGLKTGSLLSHFSVFEINTYHKLVFITDVAMNIAPDLREKVQIINNSVNYMIKMGIEIPKVAALAAVETVNPKMPATIDAAILSKMAQRKQTAPCIIDGPLAFDNAMSKESAKHKGIISEVAGDADLLFVPDIEAGNILYKALAFTQAKLAAVILGAKSPIVLTSRSDSEETKLNSIVLACIS